MIQRPDGAPGRNQYIPTLERNPLLQRHPVLMPVLLLSGSIALGTASLFVDNVFPVLMLIGMTTNHLYLSIALALGIAGILTSIIGLIEYIDRYGLRALAFLKAKEHSYANRN